MEKTMLGGLLSVFAVSAAAGARNKKPSCGVIQEAARK